MTTEHRSRLGRESGADRCSIANFQSPNPARTTECLPHLGSPRYPPAVYRDLVLEFYRKNYFHQKGHQSDTVTLAAAD